MKILSCIIIFIIVCCPLFYNEPTFMPSTAQIEHALTIEAPTELCCGVQGAAFDGEYFYIAFIDISDPYEKAIVVKTDKVGNEVNRSEVLPLGHANSITILEDGNIMIAHCHYQGEFYNRLSVLDKDSLEIISTTDLAEPFMSIAYSDKKDQFVSGEWDGKKINVHNDDLDYSHSFEVEYLSDSIPQSYYCTDYAIYSVRVVIDGGFQNYLYAYSYEGETLLEYKLDLPSEYEAEAVSVIDNEMYIICGSNSKCEIFKITELIKPKLKRLVDW